MDKKSTPPSPMEFGSMPLDPVYAWGIVLEPVETLIERTSAFIEQLAREAFARGEKELGFDDKALEQCFLAFFERLVEEGTLTRLPDAPPGYPMPPRRWVARSWAPAAGCVPGASASTGSSPTGASTVSPANLQSQATRASRSGLPTL